MKTRQVETRHYKRQVLRRILGWVCETVTLAGYCRVPHRPIPLSVFSFITITLLRVCTFGNYTFSWTPAYQDAGEHLAGYLSRSEGALTNYTQYQVTFTAAHADPNFQDYETITITVPRPVTLKRICEFWLRKNDGADLDRNGIVNFEDYALCQKFI